MYAIIQTGGKQYRAEVGDVLQIEKLEAEIGSEVSFDVLMTVNDGDVQLGKPLLSSKVSAKIVEHGKGPKIKVFKYKPKKDYRKMQGHRQPYSKVEILSIG